MGDHSLHPHSVGGALAGGLLMGAIHVITGADHISAVASLACGNTRTRAFWLGVRWGAGHSVGLLCVFLVVMALRVDADEGFMDSMEWWMGIAVGTLMVSLGLYGVAVADERSHAFDPHDATPSPSRDDKGALPLLDKTEPESSYGVADPEKGTPRQPPSAPRRPSCDGMPVGDDDPDARKPGGMMRAALAVVIGVIHGAAGPGAVLGILPAVALRDTKLVLGYFGGFIAATVLTMGAFAAGWGEVTHALGRRGGAALEKGLLLFSSSACCAVGAWWIWLTVSGQKVD
jgi:hypothetical protein